MYAKPLTDLTGKRTPERVILGPLARNALQTLEDLLCKATVEPLFIIDPSKPFSLYVDSCDYAVGAILTQTREADNAGPARLDYPSPLLVQN